MFYMLMCICVTAVIDVEPFNLRVHDLHTFVMNYCFFCVIILYLKIYNTTLQKYCKKIEEDNFS